MSIAGYKWDPLTNKMKVTVPKISIGNKSKGRFTKHTIFFKDDISLESTKNFDEGTVINLEVILSKTAGLYYPLGFVSPLKTYGSYIFRKALMDSGNNLLKVVDKSTRQDFMEYLYQAQKVGTLEFT